MALSSSGELKLKAARLCRPHDWSKRQTDISLTTFHEAPRLMLRDQGEQDLALVAAESSTNWR